MRLEAVALKRRKQMKVLSRMRRFSLMMFLICYAALMSAQSPDHEQNLFACKNGWDSCDRSALTQADKNEVTAAKHEQNISDCKSAWTSCDRFDAQRAGVGRSSHSRTPEHGFRLLERAEIVRLLQVDGVRSYRRCHGGKPEKCLRLLERMVVLRLIETEPI